MNESEYSTLPGADRLPLFDEDNPDCELIDRLLDPAYTGVREATDFDDAKRCLDDPSLVYSGGIRYHGEDGKTAIHAYFWKKRDTA